MLFGQKGSWEEKMMVITFWALLGVMVWSVQFVLEILESLNKLEK